jgi:hypothetical protein
MVQRTLIRLAIVLTFVVLMLGVEVKPGMAQSQNPSCSQTVLVQYAVGPSVSRDGYTIQAALWGKQDALSGKFCGVLEGHQSWAENNNSQYQGTLTSYVNHDNSVDIMPAIYISSGTTKSQTFVHGPFQTNCASAYLILHYSNAVLNSTTPTVCP